MKPTSDQLRVLIGPLGGTVEIKIPLQRDQVIWASNQVIFYLKRILKGQYLRGQKKINEVFDQAKLCIISCQFKCCFDFFKKKNGIFGFLRTALSNELCCYLLISLSYLMYSTYRIFELGLFNSFSLSLNFCIFLVLEYSTAETFIEPQGLSILLVLQKVEKIAYLGSKHNWMGLFVSINVSYHFMSK